MLAKLGVVREFICLHIKVGPWQTLILPLK